MFPSVKRINWRHLLFGFSVFAVAFFISWQMIESSRQTNSTEAGSLIQPQTVETMENSKQNKMQHFSSCNETKAARNVSVPIDAFQWCSADSSARGIHQKVITYTLFGAPSGNVSVPSRYDSLLRNISITAKQMYPGWIVRIYHNFRIEIELEKSVLIQLNDLACQFDHVDLCSVPELIESIPATLTTPINPALLRGLNPRMFRFLVMLDPNVDIFISRDTDSFIWRREVDAVDEWLPSNYTFHVMRDHRLHNHVILAGMWGAKLHQRRDLIQGLMRALVQAGQDNIKSTDQTSLKNIMWPTVQYDVMAHDSYQCQNNQLLITSPLKVYPFPTRRNGNSFVGGVGEKLKTPVKCPLACRPPDHKDWKFC